MIHKETVCFVGDNSGASISKVFHVKKKGVLGASLVLSIKRLRRLIVTKLKKGQVERAVLIRAKKKTIRQDGSSICFDFNSVALINKKNLPKAKRIYGPLAREIGRSKLFAIASVVF